ncbi:MAG TPA: trans-2-enoyl-CoA reductase family protein [Opitutales bacterium]|nr:trans-2-enoyl-CoA reductase family protein [Opitutales bacterium]
MIVQPRIRGFVCVSAHPEGCAANVREQIDVIRSKGPIHGGPKNALIIGASTGYGLATRVAAAFGSGASTIGVAYERPGGEDKCASAGWYNNAAFHREAKKAGLGAWSVNGDAFSDEIKQQVLALAKDKVGKLDFVAYSLASPRRTDPQGRSWKSCLKPIGCVFEAKHLDTDRHQVVDIRVDPATEEEIEGTVKVMGGEDFELWVRALADADLLAPGAQIVAYDYIGAEVTFPIYHDGTIGMAKKHLHATAARLNDELAARGARVFLSVNKAVVTQASSAIPAVPLYISILFKVMKDRGLHEGCIEQMDRFFREKMKNGVPIVDDEDRVRLDDWEMRPEVQDATTALWRSIDTDSLRESSDYTGYEEEFLRLFGFGLKGVDYGADVVTDLPFEG